MVEKSLYCEHKGNYGYRRIILDLKIRSLVVNHKKVQHLMKAPGLSAQIRRKRKYSSYQGKGGKKVENLHLTPVRSIKTNGKVLYGCDRVCHSSKQSKSLLVIVLDGFDSEINAYNLST